VRRFRWLWQQALIYCGVIWHKALQINRLIAALRPGDLSLRVVTSKVGFLAILTLFIMSEMIISSFVKAIGCA